MLRIVVSEHALLDEHRLLSAVLTSAEEALSLLGPKAEVALLTALVHEDNESSESSFVRKSVQPCEIPEGMRDYRGT